MVIVKYCEFYFIDFNNDLKWVLYFRMNVSVPIGLYGIQHYLSMLGSLILIPLVIVPAMGGSHVSGFLLFPIHKSYIS